MNSINQGKLIFSESENGQQHKEEVAELRKSIDNNTLAIQKMSDKLEYDKTK